MSQTRRSFLKTLGAAALGLPLLAKAKAGPEPALVSGKARGGNVGDWLKVEANPSKLSEKDFNEIFQKIFAVSKKRGPRWMYINGKWHNL